MLSVLANKVAGWPVLHHHVELAGGLRPGDAHPQPRAVVPDQLREVAALRVPGLPAVIVSPTLLVPALHGLCALHHPPGHMSVSESVCHHMCASPRVAAPAPVKVLAILLVPAVLEGVGLSEVLRIVSSTDNQMHGHGQSRVRNI